MCTFQLLIPKYLPAATKLGQGNVFTGVCDSVSRGGLCLSASWDTPPQTSPQSRHPPGKLTPAYGQRAAGTHAVIHPPGADTPWEQTPP